MAKAKRKFFVNVFTLTVLSEHGPVDDIHDAVHQMTYGDYSGQYDVKSRAVNARRMAQMLSNQGSDPGFFRLTEDGFDENEREDYLLDPRLKSFFDVEIRNEEQGGESPATLGSAKDSWKQAPLDVIASWCGIEPKHGTTHFTLIEKLFRKMEKMPFSDDETLVDILNTVTQ